MVSDSLEKPCDINIKFIFSLCIESNALEKSTNTNIALIVLSWLFIHSKKKKSSLGLGKIKLVSRPGYPLANKCNIIF